MFGKIKFKFVNCAVLDRNYDLKQEATVIEI